MCVPVLLPAQCWPPHIFSRAEFSLSPSALHDLKASVFLQISQDKKNKTVESIIPFTKIELGRALFTTGRWAQSAVADADLTWTPRCEAARRGAGRSTAAGRRAPNTEVDQGPEKRSLSSSRPETKKRETLKPQHDIIRFIRRTNTSQVKTPESVSRTSCPTHSGTCDWSCFLQIISGFLSWVQGADKEQTDKEASQIVQLFLQNFAHHLPSKTRTQDLV